MKFIKTEIEGLIIIEPKVFGDDRGYFFESFKSTLFRDNKIPNTFLQDNEVRSKRGVLRGLHYQLRKPQGKLVRVIYGSILDVAVDIRRGSPTFGHYVSVKLTDKNKKILYVPPGFAHGYLVMSNDSIIVYKCTNEYNQRDEYGIRWDDGDINIKWQIQDPIISKRDENLPLLKNQKLLPKY